MVSLWDALSTRSHMWAVDSSSVHRIQSHSSSSYGSYHIEKSMWCVSENGDLLHKYNLAGVYFLTFFKHENQILSLEEFLFSPERILDFHPPLFLCWTQTLTYLFWTSRKKESVLFICNSYMARRIWRGALSASCVIWAGAKTNEKKEKNHIRGGKERWV